MRNHARPKRFRLGSIAWLLPWLCWPAFVSAQERAVFAYADANKANGCFVHVSDKDWVEFTGDGRTLAFQETARDARKIELLDTSPGGAGVRLLANASQWNHRKETDAEWKQRWRGSWTNAVDLRPDFRKFNLFPRLQGKRDTCSVFTTVGALEFGLSRKLGKSTTLSVEFLNWASNQASGDKTDGSFFADCLDGMRKYGLCVESLMRYEAAFDLSRKPSPAALQKAEALRPELTDSLQVHWIMPPGNGEPGLTAREFAEVKGTLARGYPVAFGSGHSILLVGYRDRPEKPGDGVFVVKDSLQRDFITYPYDHVKTKPYDIFWVEFRKLARMDRKQWAYRTGVFKEAEQGNWTELASNGDKYSFKEVKRTDDYVELYGERRELTLRIYGGTYSRMFYKMPKMRNWALMYDGKWIG
jgi:hypothetical protein